VNVDTVRTLFDQGHSDAVIGGMLGVSKDAAYRLRKKYGIGQTAYPVSEKAPPISDTPLTLPPQPFAVGVPFPATHRHVRGAKRAVIIPDTHIPYQDDAAVAIAEALIKAYDPHTLVCIGDLLDAGRLSQKFPTDPARIDTLQDDINAAKVMLHHWAQLAPNADRWLLEGNHEQRLTRLVWGLDGAQRELAKLTAFQEAMTWPKMLGLDEIGWKWVDYNDQPRADILPHLLVKHGNYVSQEAGMTAKREWSKYGHSGISGHTHRANVWRHRDYNGQATWIEAGALCRFDVPGASSPNWQQAVTLIEWSEDETLMNVEQVLIRNGRAMWRGEELRG
jgi:predicted phosphodiesterase